MPDDARIAGDPSPRLIAMPAKRLWFGFAGAFLAWIVLGCADIVIIWRGCQHQQNCGLAPANPEVRILIFVVSLLLLGITLGAGAISYRNWRRLSQQRRMLDSLAVPRGEYMAVIGVILSLTLGMGMIWMALPPLFLDLCWRAR